MSIAEKILQSYIGRMSQAEKEALVERAVTYFFESMNPQEKQQLLEKLLQKVLEGVDVKEFFPSIMTMLWKRVKTDEERRSILSAMSQLASSTGGKLSEMFQKVFQTSPENPVEEEEAVLTSTAETQRRGA